MGAGDGVAGTRDAFRLVGGPPRIAPLLQDLNVEAGGSINASVRTDRVVVTWNAVPEFGTTNLNTFQVTLHATGQIEIAYNSLGSTFGAIGVAKGNSAGPINEIDYSAALPTTLPAGAIYSLSRVRVLTYRQSVRWITCGEPGSSMRTVLQPEVVGSSIRA